jgi:hypothetical protein
MKWAAKAIAIYWRSYGGWRKLFCSPFLIASAFISLLLIPILDSGDIQDKAISVIPSLLGFSLAAFTFSLGIGTDEFKLILGERRGEDKSSLVDGLSTAFVHFLFIQTIAIIFNISLESHWIAFVLDKFGVLWGDLPHILRSFLSLVRVIAYWLAALLFIYATLSGIPAVLHVYMAAKVFEAFSTKVRAARYEQDEGQ